MNSPLLIEAVRYFAVAYLLLVSLTAALGWHRPLLAYPFRIGYSAARLAVATVSFGKITMVPAGKKIKRRGSRKLRNWRFELQEYRELRAERRGETVRPSGAGWSVTSDHEDSHYDEPPQVYRAVDDDTPSVAPAPTYAPSAPASAPSPPRASSLYDDEDDEDELPLPPFFGE